MGMAEGRREEAWQHTAHLMATVLRSQGEKVTPEELNPYLGAKKARETPKESGPKLKAADLAVILGAKKKA